MITVFGSDNVYNIEKRESERGKGEGDKWQYTWRTIPEKTLTGCGGKEENRE